MSSLLKTERETIRFTPQQSRWLALSALIESRRKGSKIEAGPLLRDVGLPVIKATIFDTATPQELQQAEAELAAEEAAGK
jgi:hypothetical protein